MARITFSLKPGAVFPQDVIEAWIRLDLSVRLTYNNNRTSVQVEGDIETVRMIKLTLEEGGMQIVTIINREDYLA